MRGWTTVALLVLVFGGTAAAAAPADPGADALEAKADACVRSAAPAVAAQPGSLSDDTDFLVNDLCAADVEHFDTYQKSAALIAQLRKAASERYPNYGLVSASPEIQKSIEADAEAQIAKLTIDPQTGELIVPDDFKSSSVNGLNLNVYAANLVRNGVEETNARFKVVAAQALLAARASATR